MNKKNLKKLIKIIIAIFLFLIAISLQKKAEDLDGIEFIFLGMGALMISGSIFFLSYLIVGMEILEKAFKNIIRGKVFDENFLMTIATIRSFWNW